MSPTDDDGPGRPISFRARADFAAELAARDDRLGGAARRDLGRYYSWLADELATVSLSETAADGVLVALRDFIAQPRDRGGRPGLEQARDYRYLALELKRASPTSTSAIEAAQGWSDGQARAVLDAVERAWRLLDRDAGDDERRAALVTVGLLTP